MSKTILNLGEIHWKSLYVQEIPMDLEMDGVSMTTEECLKDCFENKLALGEVSHVDIFQNKPRKNRLDTISCSIHFKHWYKEGGGHVRWHLNRFGIYNLFGYTDSDRVYHEFKCNSPYKYFRVTIHLTQVPDDMVDTSKVDLTNTNEVLDMFELMEENANDYAMRIDEQENIMDKQRDIIEDLLKEKKNNWAKKNSGKKV